MKDKDNYYARLPADCSCVKKMQQIIVLLY